ncbi:MAG: DUF1592 domain-containing protein [Myxococcota bacterium]
MGHRKPVVLERRQQSRLSTRLGCLNRDSEGKSPRFLSDLFADREYRVERRHPDGSKFAPHSDVRHLDGQLGLVLATALCVGACTGTIAPLGGDEPRDSAADPPDPSAPPEGPTRPFTGGTLPTLAECEGLSIEAPAHQVRRLTHWEYLRTVEDTLGVALDASPPLDRRVEGFTTNADALIVEQTHVDDYQQLAEAAVAQIDDLSEFIDRYASCRELNGECWNGFIANVGLSLWRHTLDDAEVQSFEPIRAAVEAEGDGFDVAAGLALEAMLQSPKFLYLIERAPDGGSRTLDDFEIATRLSYLVLGTAPGQALLIRARDERVHTKDDIESEMESLLDDPRARDMAWRFAKEWLDIDRLLTLDRSPEQYPDFSASLLRDMHTEIKSYLLDILWDNERPLEEILTADFTYANQSLASIYGMELPGDGFERVDLSEDPTRGGLLTLPGVLALSGATDTPSFVARGLYLLEHLICDQIPPPTNDEQLVEEEPEEGRSQRYYAERRVADPNCGGCHNRIDTLAFSMTPFDGLGYFRAEDEFGNALASHGTYYEPGADGQDYDDVAGLSEILASSERVRDCFITRPIQFALARPVIELDACLLTEIKADFLARGGTYRDLLLAIATHPSFVQVSP